jgi:glutamate---cysteine ligase / carboxylate-amine ligase
MTAELTFHQSATCSFGVELELQLLNSRDFNLAHDASHLLSVLEKVEHPGEIKPEITESMIELNSSVHTRYDALLAELQAVRDIVVEAAMRLNLSVSGGGSHPFHKWSERRIFATERFEHVLKVYGYLAKQFTVFGQHVHIGCPDGDAAIYLTHMFSRYVPQFIALSAASPFQQGTDTGFQSSRLNTVSAFPLAGTIPLVRDWDEFLVYFNKMRGFGIVESMKDFYWDVRPKPEYGTVEIRVFDTPLTVERAALLAAYAQTLAHYLLLERPLPVENDVYLVYKSNRFQACRYGLVGSFIDVKSGMRVQLGEDVLATLELLRPHAAELGTATALETIEDGIKDRHDDCRWLREGNEKLGSLNDVVRSASELWMGAEGAAR